jgi:hypothetical protein
MISPEEALALGDRFGTYLVSELKQFVPILDAIYSDAVYSEARTATPLPAMPQSRLSIEWLVEETLWDRKDIECVLDTLTQQTPQVILAGPPGTSKTWIAELFARYLTQDRPGQFRTVQFHPSYSYEEFVEGLRPQTKDGGVSFEPRQGALLRLCAGLTSESDCRVLGAYGKNPPATLFVIRPSLSSRFSGGREPPDFGSGAPVPPRTCSARRYAL